MSHAASRLLTLSLARILHREACATDRGMEELHDWFRDYLRLGRALAAADINQTAWQDGMDRLFAMYEPVDLLERIDFDSVSRKLTGTEAKGRRALFQPVLIDGAAPEAASDPEPARVVITQIAYIPKGCSIPPHGHSNMVSAFLHLSGRFRVRQYDKLADYCDALVIRRSGEAVGGAGQWSSMSDVRNNVHWVTALTDDCYLFSTKVILEEAKPYHGRINIDIRAASEVGGGVLRAPKISGERADELYDSSA